MALVGEAHIVVRAITKDVAGDISSALRGVEGVASSAGAKVGQKFANSFRSNNGSMFDKLRAGMVAVSAEADNARQAWAKLQKTGFVLQSTIGTLLGSIGSLVGGLGSLAGALGGAAASGVALAGAFVSLKIGAAVAKLALSGIAGAVQKLTTAQGKSAAAERARQYAIIDAIKAQEKTTLDSQKKLETSTKAVAKAQEALNKAIKDGQEALQQLSFDAEQAAIDEKKALLNLEDAKTAYARVLDLPPNNRARKEAELALAEAELGYRRAVDTNKDLAAEQDRIAKQNLGRTDAQIEAEKELAEAKKDLSDTIKENAEAEADAAEKVRRAKEKAEESATANDPFAGLTESQKAFAQFLADMKPKLDELKEVAAKGFLPVLQEQIERLDKTYFPILKTGVAEVSKALANATVSVADELMKSANVESVKQLFQTTSKVIEDFGVIGGKALGSVLTILDEASPLTERFTGYLKDQATAFDDFLKTKQASGELEEFFNAAGDLAAEFEPIIKNVFSGFSAIIQDALKPGSGAYMLLEWLQDATEGFANLGADKEGLREFLQGATGNTISIFSSIGALIKEIIALGAMPEIGMFWDKLKEGAPYVGEIFKNGILAGPAMADLVVSITKIIAAFADSGAPKAFFETLNGVASTLADILNSDIVKPILDFIGPFAGFALAMGTLGKVGADVGKVMIGIFGPESGLFKGAKSLLGMFGVDLPASVNGFGGLLKTLFVGNPLGLILTAVGLLVAAFADLYKNNEAFRDSINTIMKPAIDALTTAFGEIATALAPVFDAFMGLVDILFGGGSSGGKGALIPVFEAITLLVSSMIQNFAPLVSFLVRTLAPAFEGIFKVVGNIVTIIGGLIKIVGELIKALFTGKWDEFGKKVGPIFKGIVQAISDMFVDAGNAIIGVLNKLLAAFFNGIGGGIADVVKAITGGKINLKKANNIPPIPKVKLAEGGTVKATTGGVYAQIAEAGRAERVEPLDASGLSQRDRAMIELLAKREQPAPSAPININVYPSEGMDERELAATVSRLLALQMRKGAVR